MENKDISQIALQRIKESGIKPISKNIFNLKRVIFWSFVGTSVVIGAISFSVSFSILFNNEWDLYNKFGFNFIFRTLPYFWFLCLLIFTISGEYYYRKILLGYRHRVVTIIGIYIVLTMLFGSVLHFFGMGETIEQSFRENIPMYRGVTFDKNEFWLRPEEGLLSGKIILVGSNLIKIIDLNDNIWTINTNDAFVGQKVRIIEGENIKIIGDIEGDSVFIAEQIRPWVGNKMHKNNSKVNKMR